MAATSVFSLFLTGCPTAISWLVVSVVVDSIYRFTGWPASHIGVEIFETSPTYANLDAAPSVVLVLGVVWVAATIFHGFPSFVFRSANTSVSAFAISTQCVSQASTAFCHPCANVRSAFGDLFTAVTADYIPRQRRSCRRNIVRRTLKNQQHPETLPYVGCSHRTAFYGKDGEK